MEEVFDINVYVDTDGDFDLEDFEGALGDIMETMGREDSELELGWAP